MTSLLDNVNATSLVLAMVGPWVCNGLFAIFYGIWLESSVWQATLGKRLMGIKVVDLQGQRISFTKSSGRCLAKGLSTLTLGIGYLTPLWDHRKQTLHDKAAGCLVVRAF